VVVVVAAAVEEESKSEVAALHKAKRISASSVISRGTSNAIVSNTKRRKRLLIRKEMNM
jgi:hypothetical protein